MILAWPQYAYIGLTLLGLGFVLAKTGEPKTGKYSFWASVFSTALVLWLLYEGGFWTGGNP